MSKDRVELSTGVSIEINYDISEMNNRLVVSAKNGKFTNFLETKITDEDIEELIGFLQERLSS